MKDQKIELTERLAQDIDTCDWDSLKSHFDRGAILIVSGDIDLASAGVALAKDNTDLVKGWIENQQIAQPTMEDKQEWEKEPRKKFAKFLIIQPYVLIQVSDS